MNFLDALNTPAQEIEAPLNLPVGTYIWRVAKVHKESTTAKGDYSIVEIPIVPVSPYTDSNGEQDVDAEELEAFGSIANATNRISFMAPTDRDMVNEQKRALHNLKRFLVDTLKVEGGDGATLKELLGGMIGAQFIASVSHRPNADNNSVYVDVKNWMPLE